jgi:hypothetical protein
MTGVSIDTRDMIPGSRSRRKTAKQNPGYAPEALKRYIFEGDKNRLSH